MGTIDRKAFDIGWFPSADAINAPKNCLLRMDNLMLDEEGALSLRQGSAKINGSPFVDLDVHSLFTTRLKTPDPFDYTQSFESAYFTSVSGIAQFTAGFERPYQSGTDGPSNHTQFFESDGAFVDNPTLSDLARYRFAGAGDNVYLNGTATAATIDGVITDDISFGSHMGQVLYARGTTKKKHDGRTERNWGVSPVPTAPIMQVLVHQPLLIASCTSGETPGFVANEGTRTFVNNRGGSANDAVAIQPDATTFRGTITKTFTTAQNYNAYDLVSYETIRVLGTDDDVFSFLAYITEPLYTDSITFMIDVSDGTFDLDYYFYEFVNGEAIKVSLTNEEYLASNYISEGVNREELLAQLEDRNTSETTFRSDKPVTDAGWVTFSIPRGKMRRVGSTTGANWSTVKALRFVVNGSVGGSGAIVRFDTVQIKGGVSVSAGLNQPVGYYPLTGRYKAIVVAARNNGTYVALSAPSAPSAEIEASSDWLDVFITGNTINAMDPQANEIWLYLMGGRLNAYYRYAVLKNRPTARASDQYVGIQVTATDRDALIANIRLETDNVGPPDDIIGIEGPHFDRTLCLTPTYLYPSRQRNPDSFATGEAIRIGDSNETGLWIKKQNENLYLGTTLDIYRLDGDWTELADGTLNVRKRPLGVTNAPVSAAVTVGHIDESGNADILVYLASDGWRVLGGPLLTTSQVDLLYRGQTRHGVSPVNIGGATARFRCAITKNMLFAITPEGASTASSTVLHVYHFGRGRWYRWPYTPAWRSLYVEPDGTLIGGETTGYVYTMDEATKQDAGVNIGVVMWTVVDDNGELFNYKDLENLSLRIDSNGGTVTTDVHLDNSGTTSSTETQAQDGTLFSVHDIAGLAQCQQVQLRITASVSTFIFRGYSINYLDNPRPLVVHDTGFVDLSASAIQWVRRLRIKARSPGTLTVTPWWDGTAGTARTVAVTANLRQIYLVPLGREDKGKTGRVVVTSTDPSQVYFVEFEFNGSGKQNQKMLVTMPVDRPTAAA